MMYRPNPAQRPRVAQSAAVAGQSFVSMAASQVLGYLASLGIIDRAERENRRRDRHIKRARRSHSYWAYGLNGARAVARRRRQRETGHNDQRAGYVQ